VLSATALRIFFRYTIAVIFAYFLLTQVRKPSRWFGRPFLWMMNLSHSPLTDWGLQHVRIANNFHILDVGCGGGRTIEKLAALAPQGTVAGVDYASGSVAASRSRNKKLIAEGRVSVAHASVSRLPFPDNTFDLVTAVETQYYLPDLSRDMQEVLRVLKPGGTLMVLAESYKKGSHEFIQRPVMKLLGSTNLSVEDQRALFTSAGFSAVEVFEDRRKSWLCATGQKPAASPHSVQTCFLSRPRSCRCVAAANSPAPDR